MNKKAFTLIELLIVVAIIAILAAIAVPNFLEAQTRSKVSRAKADMRSLATAMESYYVDANTYPPNDAGGASSQFRLNKVFHVTTPIAYMTSFPKDVFLPGSNVSGTAALDGYQYFNYQYRYDVAPAPWRSWGSLVSGASGTFDITGAVLKTWGPNAGKPNPPYNTDGDEGFEWAAYGLEANLGIPGVDRIYDPTNGTISYGDIGRFMGEVALPQQIN